MPCSEENILDFYDHIDLIRKILIAISRSHSFTFTRNSVMTGYALCRLIHSLHSPIRDPRSDLSMSFECKIYCVRIRQLQISMFFTHFYQLSPEEAQTLAAQPGKLEFCDQLKLMHLAMNSIANLKPREP